MTLPLRNLAMVHVCNANLSFSMIRYQTRARQTMLCPLSTAVNSAEVYLVTQTKTLICFHLSASGIAVKTQQRRSEQAL